MEEVHTGDCGDDVCCQEGDAGSRGGAVCLVACETVQLSVGFRNVVNNMYRFIILMTVIIFGIC